MFQGANYQLSLVVTSYFACSFGIKTGFLLRQIFSL